MVVMSRDIGCSLGNVRMEIAFCGAVDDDGALPDMPDKILFRTSWKCGDDDIRRFEEVCLFFGPGLLVHDDSCGADAHQHVLQRYADPWRAIEDDGGGSFFPEFAGKHIADG